MEEVEKCIIRVQKCDRNIKQYKILRSDIEYSFSEFHNSFRSEQAKNQTKRYTDDFEKGKSVVNKASESIIPAKLNLLETASDISVTSTERKRRKKTKVEAELRKQKLRLRENESKGIAEKNRKSVSCTYRFC